MQVAIGILIGLVAGGLGGAVAVGALGKSRLGAAQQQRKQVIDDAQREAETLRREAQITAREEAVKLRAEIDEEVAEHRSRVVKVEERVLAKEEEIDRKLTELARREQGLADRETHLHQLQEEHKQAKGEQLAALERISGMTVNEAKTTLLERVAASHAAETTVSVIELPSDDMKGRIIGREGRNIRALEHLTGVDFIIDETPQAVVLSSFDGMRREVAKLTLQKLLEDGRIHPARIEETYYQSKAEVDDLVRQAGEQAVFEAHCGEFHEELVKILGRLKFRTSYGQNVLKHTLEVVHLAGIMASELGAGVKTAKRGAMLHDLGKALSHEEEGSHALISARYAKRYGESEGVVHAIEAHHYE